MAKNKFEMTLTSDKKLGDFVFTDDLMALRLVSNYEVNTVVEEVSMADIDAVGSISRNNRIRRKFDKVRCEGIGQELLSTELCHRLLGWWMPPDHPNNPERNKSKRRMLDILGGNHRCYTLVELLGQDLIQFHVLQSDDPFVHMRLRDNLNNVIGAGTDTQHRYLNAFTEVLTRKCDVDDPVVLADLARGHHVKPGALKTFLHGESAKSIIEAHGYKTKHLTAAHLSSLRRLDDSHTVLAEAGNVANRAGMTAKDVSDMVRVVKKVKSGEQGRLKKIAEFADQYAPRTKAMDAGKVIPSLKPTFTLIMRDIRTLRNRISRIDPTLPEHLDITTKAQVEELWVGLDWITDILRKVVPPSKRVKGNKKNGRRKK